MRTWDGDDYIKFSIVSIAWHGVLGSGCAVEFAYLELLQSPFIVM